MAAPVAARLMERRSLIPRPPDPRAMPVVRRAVASPSGEVRWSAKPSAVAGRIDADQAVSFWMETRPRLRRLRVHFLLVPLAEVAALTRESDPLPGVGRDEWLLWQSLTAIAATTRLPSEAAILARRLRLPAGAQGAAVRTMIDELMKAVWENRAL